MEQQNQVATSTRLEKVKTGIKGLDEVTFGGLPQGRTTLVCGGPGSGKTLFAIEFLIHGAVEFGQPGVMVTFEETQLDLIKNVASLGFDLERLIQEGRIAVEYVAIERSEIEETGEYDLDGLFVRLAYALDSIGAQRVALDTLEALFAGLPNEMILRAELRRLFRWLKDRNLSTVVTAERGDTNLTRHGLEEYVSDCVILLDHRNINEVSTRRMRIVKYRGSSHGTNEFPFLIGETGIVVLPITSVRLHHDVSNERISTGIPNLDDMFGGQGPYRGSTILISGTAGTGKSILAMHFADASCRRGEHCLLYSFEESHQQILRNMRSVGLDLQPWVDAGLLRFITDRPTQFGLEMHLTQIYHEVEKLRPRLVILDPISNFTAIGNETEVKAMVMRLVDFLKMNQITAVFTYLSTGNSSLEWTKIGISSIIDSWLLLRDIEQNGERNRGIYFIKSRGMAHSNQIREYKITDVGIRLLPPYLGVGGVTTGSARLNMEAREREEELLRMQEIERLRLELEQKRKLAESQMLALQMEVENEKREIERQIDLLLQHSQRLSDDRSDIAVSRKVAATPPQDNN